ncbi:MAG: Glucosamine-6-phosphate deaminase [Brockia lithotrophica]|uniref:Glucosamine-6-phosphate deaminase n=1 Tax=Brockia lithotrophica TaxID=933949 RepID=A0A2T5GAT0_9BACL|nr:glucosamine-6-phosphate deaminase [Brockia lithotrophica]PTQ53299.1 MAG: Glucosamine-6-phosphate deaminase [Brockia lithotrophica]
MRLIRVKDYAAMSDEAFAIVYERMSTNPRLTLGLATGSTPVGLYERLVSAYRTGKLSFREARSFNLDEYVGLAPDHPQSYAYFMREHLFDHVDLPAGRWDIPSGIAPDLAEECARYEAAIEAAGGIDLQVLGIGPNGHIGFNEPGTSLDSRTHVVELTESTRRANARFFDRPEEVPTHAITMGLGTILRAREIILLASGESKAEAMARLFSLNDFDPELPASSLHRHPEVWVIADEAALSRVRV